MDPKGKGIVINDKEKESFVNEPKDDDYDKQKTVNSNFSFDYSRIPQSSNSHLLSIPLGKPPHFDGEDYGFWSHKMRRDRKSTRLNSSHSGESRMPSSA